jgi:hypothetical protein
LETYKDTLSLQCLRRFINAAPTNTYPTVILIMELLIDRYVDNADFGKDAAQIACVSRSAIFQRAQSKRCGGGSLENEKSQEISGNKKLEGAGAAMLALTN